MNGRVDRLNHQERYPSGHSGVDLSRTDNYKRFRQLCADHRFFVASTNFQHGRSHRVTWRPLNSRQDWSQLDHIAISYRWRTSVTDCRFHWNTRVDFDHALVLRPFEYYHAPIGTDENQTCSALFFASRFPEATNVCQLSVQHLPTSRNCANLNYHWLSIKTAMLAALKEVCPYSTSGPRKWWISAESTALLGERTKIPMGKLYDTQRKNLKRRITKSLRTDCEHWWVSKARELEKAGAIGNQRLFFQLIRQTGPKKTAVSETITEKTGPCITNHHRRLERWAEHFSEQFGSPQATLPLEVAEWEPTLTVNLDIPSLDEIRSEIKLLKLNKSPGPDGLFPVLFKYGGNQLEQELTSIMQSIWVSERVPSEWTLSTVIPIF